MSITSLTSDYSVSGPITFEEMLALKKRGVETLICTRFDCEEEGQVSILNDTAIAKDIGLEFVHIPVKAGVYPENEIGLFSQTIKQAKGNVHGYCRTGTRAAHLWTLTQVTRDSFEYCLSRLSEAGIKVEPIVDKFKINRP